MSRRRREIWTIALLIIALTAVIGWLILRALSIHSNRETYQVLWSSRHGSVEIVLARDESVRVGAIVKHPNGHPVGPETLLGFAHGRELSERFGIYEAQSGSIVGLFRETRPNELLLVADFKAGVAYSFSTRNLPEQEASRLIVSLERANGRDFTLMDWLVVFGTSDGS